MSVEMSAKYFNNKDSGKLEINKYLSIINLTNKL